jgi:hypothetical protein
MLQTLANEEFVNVALEVRSVRKGNGLRGYRGLRMLKVQDSEPSHGPGIPDIREREKRIEREQSYYYTYREAFG